MFDCREEKRVLVIGSPSCSTTLEVSSFISGRGWGLEVSGCLRVGVGFERDRYLLLSDLELDKVVIWVIEDGLCR